jgi:phosphotransferase system IIB component
VPIITAFAVIAAAVILSYVWPPIGNSINAFSQWAAHGQPGLAFTIYGVVERSLIPFGLHHVWNVPFFFQAGQFVDPNTGQTVRGEIARFIAGDPTAGHMTGGYLFKMWGLPAAALAITMAARPENRAKIGGIMFSAALTAFLTGITEPIDVLKTESGEYLKTAGPEADEIEAPSPVKAPAQAGIQPKLRDPLAAEKARSLIKALGGKANIQRVDACAETRLRIVTTNDALDEAALKVAGIEAIVRLPPRIVHLLTGLNADQYAAEMRGQLASRDLS